jgi:hypothetical protein
MLCADFPRMRLAGSVTKVSEPKRALVNKNLAQERAKSFFVRASRHDIFVGVRL